MFENWGCHDDCDSNVSNAHTEDKMQELDDSDSDVTIYQNDDEDNSLSTRIAS